MMLLRLYSRHNALFIATYILVYRQMLKELSKREENSAKLLIDERSRADKQVCEHIEDFFSI